MSQFKDVWELLKEASEPGAVLEVRNSEQKSAWITSSLLCLSVKDIVERVERLGLDRYRIRPKTKKQKLYIAVTPELANGMYYTSHAYSNQRDPERIFPNRQIIEIEIDVTE